MKKRWFSGFLALLLLLGTVGASGETIVRTDKYWRPLTVGDKGYDVMVMKDRLKALEYFSFRDTSADYTEKIVPAVKKFQACNDLEQTGMMTIEALTLLHSEKAQPSRNLEPGSYSRDASVPEPTPVPPPPEHMPERDEKGFLAAPGEYYSEDEEAGEWMYLSDTLQVRITRHSQEKPVLIWFETHILCRDGEEFLAVENNPEKPGRTFRRPAELAQSYRLVLGFTDDFYGHRVYNKELVGPVIRNGKILGDKTYQKDMNYLPNLDLLAEYPDGTMKAYRTTEYTAQELLEQGVKNTYCFGPVLLQNSEIDSRVLDKRFETRSPRQALGMIEPGHYFLLTVQGRIKESQGVGLIWMAEKMKEKNVVEALNLDGGNTVALIFRGKMLNRLATWKNESFVRSVSSLIGIGYWR